MSSELKLDSKVKRSEEPLQAGLDDEVVMMSVEKGSYYGLDPVGARIWEMLESSRTVREIVDNLLETYEVEQDVCERETISFLETLIEEDLAEVVD